MPCYRLLSYPLSERTPVYPGAVKLRIESDKQIKKGDSCNTKNISMSNHCGTHIDAPKHFDECGRALTDYTIDNFIYNSPQLIDCPKDDGALIVPSDLRNIGSCDLLLIRTGFYRYRSDDKYVQNNPGFSPQAAEFLRTRHSHIKTIGIDSLSISAYQRRKEGREAHRILLSKSEFPGEPMLIIEDLDLSGDFGSLKSVIVMPLFLEGVDSMPCTVLGYFA